MSKKVIIISGLPGSGKTTISQYLKKLDFGIVYMGKLTRKVLEEGNLNKTEKNERFVRTYLRKKYGKDIYANFIIKDISEFRKKKNVAVEGLRSIHELKKLKKFFPDLKMLFVEAPESLRHQRLVTRPVRPITYDLAKKRDNEEINVFGILRVREKADFILSNSSGITLLYKEVERILNLINDD